MERICLTALEEMSFENVDGRRTDAGYLYDSGELIIATPIGTAGASGALL